MPQGFQIYFVCNPNKYDMEGPYYRPTLLKSADRANQIWLARQVGSSTVLACLICLDTK